MIVLKTIPEIPAVAEIVDSVYRVSNMSINFLENTVSFTVVSNYSTPYQFPQQQLAPVSRTVSFAEIGALVLPTDVTGFVAIVRQAVALSMNVTLDKVPADIFAQ